jgi:hypothetical protein
MNISILFSKKKEHYFYEIRDILLTKENLDKLIRPKNLGNIEIEFEFQNDEYWKNIKYFEEFRMNESFRNEIFKKYFNNNYEINSLKNEKLYFYDNSWENEFSHKYEVKNLMLFNRTILLILNRDKKYEHVIKKDIGIIEKKDFIIFDENENIFNGYLGIIDNN